MIRVERRGAVARIELNRPAQRNALSRQLIARLHAAFADLNGDPDVGAVAFFGLGPAFCAGLDLNELDAEVANAGFADCTHFATLLATIANAAPLTIACVQGPAVAGGVGLLCACDVVWISEHATLALPGLARGVFADVLVPWILRAAGPRRATECLLTGGPWSSADAVGLGLATRVFAQHHGRPDPIEIELNRLAALPSDALREQKAIVSRLRSPAPFESGAWKNVRPIPKPPR